MSVSETESSRATFPRFHDLGTRTLDAVLTMGEAGERIGGQIVELWASAAADRLRAAADIQAAAVESMRGALAPIGPREAFDDLRQDPLGWSRKSLLSMFDGAQRFIKLIEANAQIAARTTGRAQAAAARAGEEIENAVTTCASRLRELYTTRS